MNQFVKSNIRALAKHQYQVYLGDFILFSSARYPLIWLSSEMTYFELEHTAYQLGNTTA